MVITAPRDGTIYRLPVFERGQSIKEGDALFTIVPETTERVVELWVSGNDTPLIQPGNHVRLQFEGWPAVQFAGWPSVAVGTFGGEVASIDPSDDGKGSFRIQVKPDDTVELALRTLFAARCAGQRLGHARPRAARLRDLATTERVPASDSCGADESGSEGRQDESATAQMNQRGWILVFMLGVACLAAGCRSAPDVVNSRSSPATSPVADSDARSGWRARRVAATGSDRSGASGRHVACAGSIAATWHTRPPG